MSNNEQVVQAEVVVIGGGIAGLWLLNRLLKQGYQAVLLEQHSLGGMQSNASQGMIHGGIKYALGGMLTGESEAIAAMPERWRACLEGRGELDLRGTPILSEDFYLWSTASITSRLTSFFASKATRGRVDKVGKSDRPALFNDRAFKGHLYRLVDLVLDVPALIQRLADQARGHVFQVDWQQARFSGSAHQRRLQLSPTLALQAEHWCLTAGAGNAELMQQMQVEGIEQQLRPLHQVLMEHDYPEPLYAHCMGANPSPRLTISSHRGAEGRWVWYLGGDLATSSIELSREQVIARAQREIADLFPWIDFGRVRWSSLYIDRAEPKQRSLIKPDNAFVERQHDTLVCWPTKLTLAPAMSDDALSLLPAPGGLRTDFSPLQALPVPVVGTPCWISEF